METSRLSVADGGAIATHPFRLGRRLSDCDRSIFPDQAGPKQFLFRRYCFRQHRGSMCNISSLTAEQK